MLFSDLVTDIKKTSNIFFVKHGIDHSTLTLFMLVET